ncbi:MAG: hypothetical protein WCD37_04510 [Chloroflexia bacterium]
MNTNEPWEQHPDNYQQALNPEGGAGLNVGNVGPHPEKSENVRTAYDIKALHNRLQGFTDDELKGIPVMPRGSRLEQGATYIDLRQNDPQEISARGDMEVGPGNWYVPKTEVDYITWNRLIGVDEPERTGEQ